jgi:hypothetical protein
MAQGARDLGDGDFRSLVKAIQRRGVHVLVQERTPRAASAAHVHAKNATQDNPNSVRFVRL